MEITNALLNELGADPKVYSEAERHLMGEYADRIIGGELPSLLEECKLPKDTLAGLKDEYGKNRDSLMASMRRILTLADELPGVFESKSSIFTSALSDEEKCDLVTEAAQIMREIVDLREDMLDSILFIYRGMEDLYDLQNEYNSTLARLGIISIAAKAAETAGAVYDEDSVMTPILEAYEELTDFTAFTNDLKDKAVIYEKSVEIKMGHFIDSLAVSLDLHGDGKGLSVKGVNEDAARLRLIAEDVLKTHV